MRGKLMPDEAKTEDPIAFFTLPYEYNLRDADKLIHNDRNADYGHPLDDFCDTAEYWTTWGHARGWLPMDQSLVPEDVAMMMVHLKISREGRKHKLDNIVDGPGYFGTLGMVIAERMRRGWGAAYQVIHRGLKGG
jgi:hypothetical protein